MGAYTQQQNCVMEAEQEYLACLNYADSGMCEYYLYQPMVAACNSAFSQSEKDCKAATQDEMDTLKREIQDCLSSCNNCCLAVPRRKSTPASGKDTRSLSDQQRRLIAPH